MAVLLLFVRLQHGVSSHSTAELGCRLCFTAMPIWKRYLSIAVSIAAKSRPNSSAGLDSGNNSEGTQEQLWEDLFVKPSEWWDNRLEKTSPRYPDFRHKTTREPLWLNNRCKPVWVDVQLPSLGNAHAFSAGDEIGIFCAKGRLDKAMDVLLRMEQEGTRPSMRMYSSLLKACAKKSGLAQAKCIQVHLAKHGLETTRFLGEYMVSTLVKCGGLDDGLQLFYRLPYRTGFSWTAMISGYSRAGRYQEAMKMYHWMLEEGLEPNKYTFISVLKACSNLLDLEEGKRIHDEALKYSYESDVFVGTCLINMYSKCGSLHDARKVFNELSERNVVVWNAMLAAYAHKGQAEMAVQLYEEMQKAGVSPDDRTFVSTLQAFGMLANKESIDGAGRQFNKLDLMEKAKAIHADAQKKGYESDTFVGNTLVSMYGKFRSFLDARNVFDKLSHHDPVSWNAMLAAYAQSGQADCVFHLYDQMCNEGVSPDVWTFVSVLQACGVLAGQVECSFAGGQSAKLKLLEKGRVIHLDAERKGYNSHVYLGNALITMYGKCGSIIDAQNVFVGLLQRDVVSWNAMLAVLVELGQGKEALQLYEQMRDDGPRADVRTFMSALQACGMLADKEPEVFLDGQPRRVRSLEKGKAIHADAWSKCCDGDVFVASTLVTMYGMCGSVVDALNVFNQLSQQDAASWNAMLAACIQQGQSEKALQLYEQLREDSVSPDARTFVGALQACSMLGEKQDNCISGQYTKVEILEKGKAVHADAHMKGYASDVFVGSTLISMYGKCGSILDAQYVFDGLPHWDIVVWNVMLAAYAQQGQAERTLELYQQMQMESVSPNNVTFVSALEACRMLAEKEDVAMDMRSTKLKALENVKSIHAITHSKGCDEDILVGNTLVSTYEACGSIGDAQNVFDGLSERTLVSWNAMLAAYAQQGHGEKALQLYRQMQEEEVSQNDATLVNVLQVCSTTGSLDVCREIHDTLASMGNDTNLHLASSLIHAYGRCASMVDAQAVFDALPQPDLVAWTALITGYAREGNSVASLQCYDKMRLAGIKPDAVTFVSLLSACSHSGCVDRGIEYFESMTRDHGILPEIDHYAIMVDLLVRAGYFNKVEQMLSSMPMPPDMPMWLSLLAACRKHGKVVLGKQAFDAAVQLQPNHAAAYVLMSNVYADAGLWDSASQVSALEQRAKAWKKPGHSWIEHNEQVHTFVVEDHMHPQKERLYNLVARFRHRAGASSTHEPLRVH